MTQLTPRAIGVVWFRREDYAKARKLFKDGHKLSPTFDQWLKRAKKVMNFYEAQGYTVEKAYIDLNAFPEWCRSRGLDIDAEARKRFANEFVAGKYGQTH